MENSKIQADLRGRVAVITGGGGVLGRSLTRALSASGARTVVIGRTLSSLEETAAAVMEDGGDCSPVVADVLDQTACRDACGMVLDDHRRVDILINAVGGASPAASPGV